jgi:anaerobic selenocysteine-containing dehydrogenase
MCGIAIEHRDGEVLAIRGDGQDVLSHGHICPKGAALADLHADPERIRQPLRRTERGWEPVDWDVALDDIAARVLALQRAHGRDAVATYVGNPTVHHLGASLMLFPFLAALGTRNRFSATSLDQLPQQLAVAQLFGHQALFPIADVDRTDFFLCLGGNPLASGGSVLTAPGMRHRLRALRERGGRFVVVDPRRTESAAAADQHLAIRPGTDAWLLLAMLGVLFAEGRVDLGAAAAYTDGLETLRALVAGFTPERAAPVCGVDAEVIRGLAREFAAAGRAIAYCRVGVCQQRHGGLAAYLVYVLGIVTGNLDRPGGMMFSSPAIDPLPIAARLGMTGTFDRYRSRVSGHPEFSREFPAACLAEEIETPGPGQIRALITHAGNPVLSAPNGRRLEAALQRLELIVAFDFYLTETTRHAHYILPPAGPLESAEYDVVLSLLAVRNHAKFADPMVGAPAGARQDWEALGGLTWRLLAGRGPAGQAAGLALRTTLRTVGITGLLDLMLRTGPHGVLPSLWRTLARRPRPAGVPPAGLSLGVLRRHPHGIDLGPLEPRLPGRLFTPGQRINLVPELYARALADFAADAARAEAEVAAGPDGLVLIGRRHVRSNNSWMHNSHRLVRGRTRCTLLIHPDDAEARGLRDGASATVRSRVGEVTLPVEISDTIRPGVVSIPHGFGHDRPGVGWTVARAHGGVSANDLTDDRFLDTLTGNAAFNGVPVTVRPGPVPAAGESSAFAADAA